MAAVALAVILPTCWTATAAGAFGDALFTVPYLPTNTYYRLVAEPAFARAVRSGASRDAVRAAADRWAYGRNVGTAEAHSVPRSAGAEYAVFPVHETACGVDGDIWTIEFDRAEKVTFWSVSSARDRSC
ncbi:MAG TPA: hypothetical protein VFB22_05930 [Candidatus Baltobacteraceae bacterium]|nr:hypothetical protein [Candidatus Baltobacteraceae bacterium]